MDVSNIAQAKRVAEQATVQEHLPWYIIDPTGVLIRKQREQYFSKRTVTRMYTRPREASRVSTGVEVSRLGELRHWTLARITLFPAWDHVAAIALIFTAAVTPFEVGFLPPSRSALEPLFLINRMVDCVFVADVVFQFFIMVPTDDGGDGLTQYEMRLPKIALRYVRGWFALDIVSIAPSIFDILPLINPDGPRAGGAKALRTLRALRLVKLLRLVRASRMFQRVKERISLSHTTMTVMRLVALTALLAHGFACVLAISTTFADSPLDTWLATFGYCRPGGTGSAAFDADGERTVVCVPEAYRYLQCLWWAVSLLTGYAADPQPGPYPAHYSSGRHMAALALLNATDLGASNGTAYDNAVAGSGGLAEWQTKYTTGEYILLLLLLLSGVFAWTIIFGRLLVSMTRDDPDKQRFAEELDAINRMCRHYQLSSDLTRELRRYYFHTVEVHYAESRAAAFQKLSPELVERVTWQLNHEWLEKVPCLQYGRSVSDSERRHFLVAMVLRMRPAVFAPKEIPPAGRLYFITEGTVTHKSGFAGASKDRVLRPGDHWGEEEVLLSQLRGVAAAVTNTYVHVNWVDREQLFGLRGGFPHAFRAFQTWTIFRAALRELVDQARRRRSVAARSSAAAANQASAGSAPREGGAQDKGAVEAVEAAPETGDGAASGFAAKSPLSAYLREERLVWSRAQLEAMGAAELLQLRRDLDEELGRRLGVAVASGHSKGSLSA